MIPTINTDIEAALSGLQEKRVQDIALGMVYKYDFSAGDFVLVDGRPVLCTDEEAVKQWAELCIRVPFGKHRIYEGVEFGTSTVEQLINRKALPPDYVNSVVYADLSEKLTQHKLITGMQNFEITNSDGTALITFTLLTTLGEIDGSVTINAI